MPIYEFECAACGANFEELIYGNAVPACPSCHSGKTTRLPSCASFRTPTPNRGDGSPYRPPTITSSVGGGGGGGCGPCSGGNCASCK